MLPGLVVVACTGEWTIADMKFSKRLARLCLIAPILALAGVSDSGPTAEEYIGYTNGSAHLVPIASSS